MRDKLQHMPGKGAKGPPREKVLTYSRAPTSPQEAGPGAGMQTDTSRAQLKQAVRAQG